MVLWEKVVEIGDSGNYFICEEYEMRENDK